MSFTQDELQAFNTILEQKLSEHRREMERTLDQRMNVLKRDLEQHLVGVQQDVIRNVNQKTVEQQSKLKELLAYTLETQHTRNTQDTNRGSAQRQQQLQSFVENSLAAQLLAIEQLINQYQPSPLSDPGSSAYTGEAHPGFDAIEVQTEIPWEDLGHVFSNVLDDRLASLNSSILSSVKNIESYLSALLLNLRDELLRTQSQPYSGNMTNIQDVFRGIEQLERIIESMQVAMTANHALLSNRLYHHQQLPLERAHVRSQPTATQDPYANGTKSQLTLPKETDTRL